MHAIRGTVGGGSLPAHPEHDERRGWIGRPFDPEAFDPAEFEDNLRNGRLAAFDDEM